MGVCDAAFGTSLGEISPNADLGGRVSSGETPMEARTDTDVQLVRHTWG